MEVDILNSKHEKIDNGLTKITSSDINPTHSNLMKTNTHNIHTASFGSASSTCSSNSSSSLSNSGMAYSPAIRGHRDKFSASGRPLNIASNENRGRKKSSSQNSDYAQGNINNSENNRIENGHKSSYNDEDDSGITSNEPKSLEDFSVGTTMKLRERKKCARVNVRNMNGNSDIATSYGIQKPTSHRSLNGNPETTSDSLASSNNSHTISPGSNSGKPYQLCLFRTSESISVSHLKFILIFSFNYRALVNVKLK